MLTFKQPNIRHIHFIGIGGVSTSGLAEICLDSNYKVSGSDMKDSLTVNRLRDKGVTVYIGHDAKNVQGADLVIYTSAISDDNPEFLQAKKHNILLMDRATFLGKLMKDYKQAIAVSGTHGKTTTTGMLATIFQYSEEDPTIMIGGNLNSIGGNIKIGSNNVMITEACEYKSNFLKFHPTLEIVLNIDKDHMDYFTSIEHIIDTFKQFTDIVPSNGKLVINSDDKNCLKLIDNLTCSYVTFGIDNDSDYKASNIINEKDSTKFTLTIKNKIEKEVVLSVNGQHNVYNSLAAITAAIEYGLDVDYVISKISLFTGTERRYQFKGVKNGITIIDDYAHHPTAIKTTISSTKKIYPDKKVCCIFQPHTFSRTRELLSEFSQAFTGCDTVIIPDIYAAREKDDHTIHSKDLVNKIVSNGVNAVYLENFEIIQKHVLENCSSNDIVLTMGAGNVYEIGNNILAK